MPHYDTSLTFSPCFVCLGDVFLKQIFDKKAGLMNHRIEEMDASELLALIMDHYTKKDLKTQRRLYHEIRNKKIEELRKILEDMRKTKFFPESFA